MGFIKKDGSDLFTTDNFRYDSASNFSEGLAAAKDSSGKWGFIKTDGSSLFETNNFRYDYADRFTKAE